VSFLLRPAPARRWRPLGSVSLVFSSPIPRRIAKYLAAHDSEELNKRLFDLYKAWRDENKVGFNRVDLEKLAAWLEERAG